jgi:hypothetical protein
MSGIHAVLRVFVASLVAGVILSAAPARADTLPKEDRAALQSLVQQQIEAFQRDDGAAAYAFATDRLHQVFPDVETFMKMVRDTYPPVYRPRSVVFGDIVDTSQGPIQVVYLGGPDGLGYIAYYSFEKQPDGRWLISGCLLQKNPASAI